MPRDRIGARQPGGWIGRAPDGLLALTLLGAGMGMARAQGLRPPQHRATGQPRLDDRATLGAVNAIYRPTVVLRKGNGRGSGTVLASVPGETLILTAAHVLGPEGALEVELHPFNLGMPDDPRGGGRPRVVPAEIAARDRAADVALVRIRGMAALPYVARLGPAEEPAKDTPLRSVGYDEGRALIGWRTTAAGSARIDLYHAGDPRWFTITSRPSLEGRSGGGLFRPDGTVIGVCIGRVRSDQGRWVGVFASMQSIVRLIRDSGLEGRIPVDPGRRSGTPTPS